MMVFQTGRRHANRCHQSWWVGLGLSITFAVRGYSTLEHSSSSNIVLPTYLTVMLTLLEDSPSKAWIKVYAATYQRPSIHMNRAPLSHIILLRSGVETNADEHSCVLFLHGPFLGKIDSPFSVLSLRQLLVQAYIDWSSCHLTFCLYAYPGCSQTHLPPSDNGNGNGCKHMIVGWSRPCFHPRFVSFIDRLVQRSEIGVLLSYMLLAMLGLLDAATHYPHCQCGLSCVYKAWSLPTPSVGFPTPSSTGIANLL
ncbi:hypothetical protein B0T20DRAFT_120016 [Sordaria brevicollis]|uniref:Uncharacterized protein n=1 Tax=Sordaria brevicollis TaxID=83679 RepID=A0AAE0PKU3_SORBR|nr:hypothetical protein B0T20DRAFT_120016 [Sordaria brevicollis]